MYRSHFIHAQTVMVVPWLFYDVPDFVAAIYLVMWEHFYIYDVALVTVSLFTRSLNVE